MRTAYPQEEKFENLAITDNTLSCTKVIPDQAEAAVISRKLFLFHVNM